MVGYSGTPLLKKLGFKDGKPVVVLNAPPEYLSWLGAVPAGMEFRSEVGPDSSAVHAFCTKRDELERTLVNLRHRMNPAGILWISWPKKASGVTTDISEDVIREVALPLGYVDVKVCAVSDVWSGLKLVIRKSERGA